MADNIAEEMNTPEQSRPTDQNMEFEKENVLYNMHLAHELAMNTDLLDPNKKPEETLQSQDPLLRLVKSQVHAAFWDLFRSEISRDPPILDMAFQLLKDIKESLYAVMTPNVVSLRTEVEEVLDINHMKQQVEHGALDVPHYAKFIISVMSRICAPIRDGEIARLGEETDLVQIFRGILETLDLMKLDLIKFKLTSIKPGILANQMEYERQKFSDFVKMANGQLPLTESWLQKHITSGTSTSFETVVYDAFMDILTWPSDESYPETLLFDAPRLVLLKRDYYKLNVAASIILQSFACTPPEIVTNAEYKLTLKSHICSLLNGVHNDETLLMILPNIVYQLALDADEKLKEVGLEPLSETQKTAINDQITGTTQPDNKIRSLVSKRIIDYLRSSLENKDEDVTFPAALALFSTELKNLKTKFKYLTFYNLNICKEQYLSIINSKQALTN